MARYNIGTRTIEADSFEEAMAKYNQQNQGDDRSVEYNAGNGVRKWSRRDFKTDSAWEAFYKRASSAGGQGRWGPGGTRAGEVAPPSNGLTGTVQPGLPAGPSNARMVPRSDVDPIENRPTPVPGLPGTGAGGGGTGLSDHTAIIEELRAGKIDPETARRRLAALGVTTDVADREITAVVQATQPSFTDFAREAEGDPSGIFRGFTGRMAGNLGDVGRRAVAQREDPLFSSYMLTADPTQVGDQASLFRNFLQSNQQGLGASGLAEKIRGVGNLFGREGLSKLDETRRDLFSNNDFAYRTAVDPFIAMGNPLFRGALQTVGKRDFDEWTYKNPGQAYIQELGRRGGNPFR